MHEDGLVKARETLNAVWIEQNLLHGMKRLTVIYLPRTPRPVGSRELPLGSNFIITYGLAGKPAFPNYFRIL